MISFATKALDVEKSVSEVLGAVISFEIYDILVLEFEVLRPSNIVGESQFKAKIRVNVSEKENIDKFFQDFGSKSGTSYNKFKGDVLGKGKQVIIGGSRKCEHNVRRQKLKDGLPHSGPGRQPGAELQPGKNTICPANLTFSLSAAKQNAPKNRSLQRRNEHERRTKYPLELTLDFTHNHSINSANALRFRPVSEETKKRFIELFEEEHSPSSAFAQYKKNVLHGKNSLEIITLMTDRSIVPDYFWVFHCHKKYMNETRGPQYGPEAYKIAEERITRTIRSTDLSLLR